MSNLHCLYYILQVMTTYLKRGHEGANMELSTQMRTVLSYDVKYFDQLKPKFHQGN